MNNFDKKSAAFWWRHPARAALVGLIRAYQHTASPDHGPIFRVFYPQGACRFHPTCSEYAAQAITNFGMFRGTYLSLKRILRCHPWAVGGHDPLPNQP